MLRNTYIYTDDKKDILKILESMPTISKNIYIMKFSDIVSYYFSLKYLKENKSYQYCDVKYLTYTCLNF